jgi:hypothetical protein
MNSGMNFHSLVSYVKKHMDPQRFVVVKLSALPTMIKSIIKRQGVKTDAEVLEEIYQLASKYEKQIEETGFEL